MGKYLNLNWYRSLVHSTELLIHKGDRYTCPFCGYASKDLGMAGFEHPVLTEKQVIGGSRRASSCYSCGARDREKLLYVYLKEKMQVFGADKNKSILHIAPEKRLTKKFLAHGFSNYVCGDLFTPGYDYADHVVNMTILEIPYPDNTFDLVLCNHVLEHVPDDAAAMKELHRVLAKSGKAILQVPISATSAITDEEPNINDVKEQERRFGQYDHVRLYGQDYAKRLSAAGFRVERILAPEEFDKYGVNLSEELYVCSKG